MNTTNFGPRYELISHIARGGMSTIHLARSTGAAGFEKKVVIKRILPELSHDATFVEMFLQEAKLIARLAHPNIVQVFDFGTVGTEYFMAMEHVDGRSLLDLVVATRKSGIALPLPLMVKIASLVAEGLHHAHSAVDKYGMPLKLVHRDVSPSNILISFAGAVKLTDFGIATAVEAAHKTLMGFVKGKYAYMAPEQALGEPVDHRADLFSLGAILYETTTMHHLFARKTEAATINALIHDPIRPPIELAADYPTALQEIVLKALQRPVEDRYQTAKDFHIDLERFLARTGQSSGTVEMADFMTRIYESRRQRIAAPETRVEAFVDALNHGSASASIDAGGGHKSWHDLALPVMMLLAGTGLIWMLVWVAFAK